MTGSGPLTPGAAVNLELRGSISTQGSWNFHYDDALGDVMTEARHTTSGWSER